MDVSPLMSACLALSAKRHETSHYGSQTGTSLVELMVAVTIAAILIANAIPALDGLIKHQQQVTAINTLLSSLYHARSEAILRNSEVVLCKSNNGLQCTRSGEWEQGWMIFEDNNGDRGLNSTETIIAKQTALPGVSIYYRAFGSNHYLVYVQNGATESNGTYTFCSSTDGIIAPSAIILYKTGRPRRSTVRSNGTALRCPP